MTVRRSAVTRAVPAAGTRAIQQRSTNGVVPPAKRPTAPAPSAKRLLMFDVLFGVTSSNSPHQVRIEPASKTLVMSAQTYAWLKNDGSAVQDLGLQKAEAVRQMKTTMWEGAAYAPKADPNRQPPKPQPGIRQLAIDMSSYVGRLAAAKTPEEVGVLALEYARYRDQMATLRAAFTEAEGSFELAQELLVQKMGIDD